MNDAEKQQEQRQLVKFETPSVPGLYVLQTQAKQEENAAALIRAILEPELFSDCFIPKRQLQKKLGGKWVTVEQTIFSGYLFIETKWPNEVFFALKYVPKLTKLLHGGDFEFIALTDCEMDFIRKIGRTTGDHIAHVSGIAFSEGDQVQIIEGDLELFRGQIVRFDFKKRQAVVQVELFQRVQEIRFGFEFLRRED